MTEAWVHDWRIPEREYVRQESRRGRRHAFERLDPRRTALVVVDLVPFFVDQNAYTRGTLPHVNRLAAALRASGGTVAWVVPADVAPSPVRVEFLGAEVAELYGRSGGAGTPRERVAAGLDVHDADLTVEKTSAGAFYPGASPLPGLLAERDIDTLVVTGTVTNVCVESTVREASQQDYRVVLVADACASVNDDMHNATLTTVYRTFGDVRSTDEVMELIARG